jgi:dienelactone hydrolase
MSKGVTKREVLEEVEQTALGRIAFMGESLGGALGLDLAGVEDRFKAVIILDGGFYNEKPLPGTDQVDFAPHIKAPTLMIAGKFDWIFLGKDGDAPDAGSTTVRQEGRHVRHGARRLGAASRPLSGGAGLAGQVFG